MTTQYLDEITDALTKLEKSHFAGVKLGSTGAHTFTKSPNDNNVIAVLDVGDIAILRDGQGKTTVDKFVDLLKKHGIANVAPNDNTQIRIAVPDTMDSVLAIANAQREIDSQNSVRSASEKSGYHR